MKKLPCPSCGQPSEFISDGRCPRCERLRRSAKRKRSRKPKELTVEEALAALNAGRARVVRWKT